MNDRNYEIWSNCSFLFGTPPIINNYFYKRKYGEFICIYKCEWLLIDDFKEPPPTPQHAEQVLIDKILNSDSYDNFKNHI
jgi:hypothetical protein